MTISNTTTKVTYTGDGSNRRFDIPFPYLENSELSLIVTDGDGVETAVTTAFEVDTSETFLTYPTTASQLDPLPSTHKFTIVRNTPLTQDNNLIQQATLDKESMEASLDKLTRITQELAEQSTRAIKTKVSGSAAQSAEDYLDAIQQASSTATDAASAASASATAAAGSASTASTKAGQAADSQTAAANYATTAYNCANNAEQYKDAAAEYATAAEGSKDDALEAQTAAEAAQAAAEGYKDDAADAATAAGSSEATALQYKNSAEAASEAATAAKEAAVEAKGDAQTAATSAQAAAAQLSAHNTSDTAHADIRLLIAGKQDTLTAGDNIQITNNVISATGGGGGGGSANWGSIGGTLSNQTDLKNALDGKQAAGSYAAASHTHTSSEVSGLPTKLSDFTDDLGTSPTHTHSQYLTSVSWNDVGSKPSSFTPSSHTHTSSEVSGLPTKLSDFTDDLGTSPTHTHSQYLTSVPVATTSTAGKVKPDGTTITVSNDGTISASASGSGLTATYDSTNKILTLE